MTVYADWRRPMAEDVIATQVALSAADVAGRSVWLPAGARLCRAGYCPELGQWLALADVAPLVGVLVRFDAPTADRWYEPWDYDEDGPDTYHAWDCRDNEPEPPDPSYEWTRS